MILIIASCLLVVSGVASRSVDLDLDEVPISGNADFDKTNLEEYIESKVEEDINKILDAKVPGCEESTEVPVTAASSCPIDFVYYEPLQFCYMVDHISPIDFPTIKQRCINSGGKLAAVDSQEKHDYLTSVLSERPYKRICIAGEEQYDGSWSTDDGTRLSYFNWYPGQPESSYQTCIVIKSTSRGDLWFDASCSYSEGCIFVCEV